MADGQGGGGAHQNYHFLLQQHQLQLRPAPAATGGSNYRMRGGCGGEIVEVQGGHIMRSTGRKDRHSKVCTAKGPRDRRVRLSAHTAIQFYDVQDRLGYDRPSKAVDWLIKNAKAAIDELEKLPPWNPTTAMVSSTGASTPDQTNSNNDNKPETATAAAAMEEDVSHINAEPAAATYDGFGRTPSSSAFFPPSLDSDSIADTIKSFFPIAGPSSSTIGFQSYQAAAATATEHHQPLSIFPPKGNPGAAQDLRLSLQSYQDPMLVQHHQTHASAPTTTSAGHHTPFFSTSGAIATPLPLVYDAAAPTIGWADHNHPRGAMASWIAGGAGGYVFSVPPQPPPLHPALSQSSHVTQRGPLQSSNPSANYAWVEPSSVSGLQEHGGVYSSAFGFTPGSSCFSSFQIPTRAQGEEEQDGSFDKPSSAFSASRR